MRLTDIPTPAVVIESSKLERNLDRMQQAANARGLRLRPHAKTHKSPRVAAMQIERGAVGICCAKLGEAEAFADAGVRDIRLPYPLHPVNADRVFALADRVALSFIVDDIDIARAWSDAARQRGWTLDVLIKVDVGFHRCGIDPAAQEAPALVSRIAALPGIGFRGLLSHAGQAYSAKSEEELAAIAATEAELLADLAARSGVDCEEISVGSTPTARFSLEHEGLTELRPGNYAYFDRTQVGLGSATFEECALTVLARVVSHSTADRFILDSGTKTLTTDAARGAGSPVGYGAVLASIDSSTPDPDLVIERLSEEHANVRSTGGAARLRTGELVRIVPNHSCVVSNLVDYVWLVDGEHVIEKLQVAARGKIT
jgi:D-serine deaminase-like pyridoxal phosphate-dependent protein